MSSVQRLKARMQAARQFSEGMLSQFTTPQQWTHQVHDKANHALWFAGHMGVTDNFFISLVAPEQAAEKSGYNEKFGLGSHPTANPDDYPPPEEVLAYMRDRRETLLKVLDGFQDADLSRPTPEGAPEFLPDAASVFETSVWHEGLHAGQVTVAHRELGNAPLFTPPAD